VQTKTLLWTVAITTVCICLNQSRLSYFLAIYHTLYGGLSMSVGHVEPIERQHISGSSPSFWIKGQPSSSDSVTDGVYTLSALPFAPFETIYLNFPNKHIVPESTCSAPAFCGGMFNSQPRTFRISNSQSYQLSPFSFPTLLFPFPPLLHHFYKPLLLPHLFLIPKPLPYPPAPLLPDMPYTLNDMFR